MRFFLTIEYDGSEYIGWQRQNSGLSVQEVVENSIYKIIQINLNIYGSGRTDAGVHATGQVAHVDIITKEFEENRLMDAINAYLLDHKIKVTDVRKTIGDAHARFSALSREYEYVILNRSAPPAIEEGKVWHQRRILNIKKMQEAASYFVGTHDFTSLELHSAKVRAQLKLSMNLQLYKKKIKYSFVQKLNRFFTTR